ncbi:RelA/SpoT domain-containing protein [Pseudomonas aeruginosa]|uniref:GTP pyrophosphokinase n=1 Tax=Pseudomonas aeruginosa TaxID=287 RepID=UPI001ADFE0E6|nr:RelA/SpoT domain-containing protein [Pseudomonas aeruginosa]MDV7896654.1 RelA/SpoT domain-containing protein [Pseudomonas aeruginosa]MED5087632.1 RelA/SpoT domain-containing protein [Pseudomonas aeruginosa]HBO2000445.1 RelA/SpoT domain-containing protein [Pseudomonas aeruginosa]
MTEEEYLKRFRDETPRLQAWGLFVISELNKSLIAEYGDEAYERWIKIPPKLRIKSESSLIAKAFILNRGWFTNIYEDITDKVGVRYVVGLTDQILKISELIKKSHNWAETNSKEFDEWKRTDPRIFDYQSAHFVLTSLDELHYDGINIPPGTKCEIQIRTLLQHAYAELSHDTLYKSNVTSEPEVHRLFAKSMALMETTDDMLLRAHTSSLESITHLEDIKREITEANKTHFPQLEFSSKPRENDYLIDQLRPLIKQNLNTDLSNFLKKYSTSIANKISDRRASSPLFELEAITLVYYLAKRRSSSLPNYWPFEKSSLEAIYSDVGVAPPWTKD